MRWEIKKVGSRYHLYRIKICGLKVFVNDFDTKAEAEAFAKNYL